MDGLSMALGSPMLEPMNRVMAMASAKMTELSDKMLSTGYELKFAGKEMGKGELLDLMA